MVQVLHGVGQNDDSEGTDQFHFYFGVLLLMGENGT
jgi:hypothetical protein